MSYKESILQEFIGISEGGSLTIRRSLEEIPSMVHGNGLLDSYRQISVSGVAIDSRTADELVPDFLAGHVQHFSSKEALIKQMKQVIQAGDVLLVKGSRNMKLEDVVQQLV